MLSSNSFLSSTITGSNMYFFVTPLQYLGHFINYFKRLSAVSWVHYIINILLAFSFSPVYLMAPPIEVTITFESLFPGWKLPPSPPMKLPYFISRFGLPFSGTLVYVWYLAPLGLRLAFKVDMLVILSLLFWLSEVDCFWTSFDFFVKSSSYSNW